MNVVARWMEPWGEELVVHRAADRRAIGLGGFEDRAPVWPEVLEELPVVVCWEVDMVGLNWPGAALPESRDKALHDRDRVSAFGASEVGKAYGRRPGLRERHRRYGGVEPGKHEIDRRHLGPPDHRPKP